MAAARVKDAVAKELSGTPFACSSLTQLSGGTANFLYRGLLSQPLPDGTTTIIVKHAENYLASNAEFKLSAKRCLVEEFALRAVNHMSSVSTTNEDPNGKAKAYQITAKSPRLLHFAPSTYTQVMEDLPDAVDLKTFMLSPGVAESLSREWTLSIGRTLGTWLRSFHSWVADPTQKDVATQFGEFKVMRDLKFSINYDGFLTMVDVYPDILAGSRAVFEKVRELAAEELKETQGTAVIGPIHGDFWSGNVLLPPLALNETSLPATPLLITDWELAQIGPRALDLGQMIAELYMLKHFKDIDAGLWVIEGFAAGYQDIPEDVAFRTIIHVGVHFIFWGTTVPGWGSKEQVRELVKLGRDLIVKAWERERAWFESGFWGVLFRG
ncbi:kinase-like domain-containing protein [Aspergillus varians]